MRRLISIGVLALFLAMLAAPVLAGNVDLCEQLKDDKYSKGLYGLCIAYHNASTDQAREKILDNYNKKATGPDDIDLPGTSSVECSCWGMNDLVDAVALMGDPLCTFEGGSYTAEWTAEEDVYLVIDQVFCNHQVGTEANLVYYTSELAEQFEVCITDIETICSP